MTAKHLLDKLTENAVLHDGEAFTIVRRGQWNDALQLLRELADKEEAKPTLPTLKDLEFRLRTLARIGDEACKDTAAADVLQIVREQVVPLLELFPLWNDFKAAKAALSAVVSLEDDK